jgi:Bacterial Ig-like domain (group 3)
MNRLRRWFAAALSLSSDARSRPIRVRSGSSRLWPLQKPWRCNVLAVALALFSAQIANAQSTVIDEPTSVTLMSSANPAGDGNSITLTALVLTAQGGAVPGGTIQFVDETTMAVLGWADVATPSIIVKNLTTGRHLIRAEYSGTSDFQPLVLQPSQSALLTQTELATPDVTVSSSQNPSVPGQVVTLTAMVTSHVGTPKGTVTFSDGRSVIAAHVGLDRRGTASFTTSALDDGTRGIVAIYEGDGEYAATASERLVQDVEAAQIRNPLFR